MEPKGGVISFFKEVIDAVKDELKDCKEVYFDEPNKKENSNNYDCGQTPNNSTYYSTSTSTSTSTSNNNNLIDPKSFDPDLKDAVNDIQLQIQNHTLVYTCSFDFRIPNIQKAWIGFYNYFNAPREDTVERILMSDFINNKSNYKPVVVDYNRDYVVKFWSFEEGTNNFKCTRYGYLNSNDRFVLLGGDLGEQMFIKWSHHDMTSSNNFVTIHSTTGDGNQTINQTNAMLGGTMLTNQGGGYFKSSRFNDGLKYYAVMWGAVQNGNSFIRLAISKPIGPIKRNLAIVEVPSLVDNSSKLGIYISEPSPCQSGEYVYLNQGAPNPNDLKSNLSGENGKPIPLSNSNGFIKTSIDSGKPIDLEKYYGVMVGNSPQEGLYYLQDSNSCKGYTTWMTDNWEKLKLKKFRDVTLPGSRDIGSSYINENSKRSPWCKNNNVDHDTLLNWSIHQTASITRQLEFGIRYFNIQVAPDDTGKFWIANDMLCITVEDALKEFYQFHKDHESTHGDRNEIIILHWNKIDQLDSSQHQQLMSLIKNGLHGLLGTRVVGNIKSLDAEFHSYSRTPFINFYDDGYSSGKSPIDHLVNNIGFWYATDIDINYNEDHLSTLDSTIQTMNNITNESHNKFWLLPCYLNSNLNNLPSNQSSLLNWTYNSILSLTETLMKFERSNKKVNIIVTDFSTFYPITSYSIKINLN